MSGKVDLEGGRSTKVSPRSDAQISPGRSRDASKADTYTPSARVGGAVYGRAFRPARLPIRAGKAVDPVVLQALTKSGDSQNGWSVTASWSGGTAPYTAVASTDPGFEINVWTLGMEIQNTGVSAHVAPEDSGVFLNVVDGSTVSPAVQGSGFDPLSAPHLDSSSAIETWWGETVNLTGEYFSPIAADNLVFMQGPTVKASLTNVPAGSRFADSLSFVVPEDSFGGSVYVQSHGKVIVPSDAPELKLIPTLKLLSEPVIPFSNIRGVIYAPQTGHIWVAADNIIQEIDIFSTTPSLGHSIAATKPNISRVTDGGYFLYVEGGIGKPTISKVDVTSGSKTPYAQTTDSGFNRDINPVGITARINGSSCVIADAEGNHLVRVYEGNSADIVDNYGFYTWSFSDPTPIDTASNNYVLVVDGVPDKMVALVHPYVTTPDWVDLLEDTVQSLKIDHDVSSDFPIRFYYSEYVGMAEVYNRNDVGGNGVKYHGGFVWDEPGGHIRLTPNPFYRFYDNDPQRVILSNAVPGFPYTSEHQVADRIIQMKVHAWDNVPVKLRVIDPPDMAPYAPEDGWTETDDPTPPDPPYEGNDNFGTDYGVTLNSDGSGATSVMTASTGSDMTLTFYLNVPERYSGNNFQVEMTKCAEDGTPLPQKIPALSAVYTSWKRVFIERDKMFRSGGVLAEDYDPNACGGEGQLECNQIRVYGWTNVQPGDWIVLFDKESIEAAGSSSLFPYGFLFPTRYVMDVSSQDAEGLRVLTLDSDLGRAFFASPHAPDSLGYQQPVFCDSTGINCHASGFGVVTGCDLSSNQLNASDGCFFDVDLRGIEQSFGDAFVEFFAPRKGNNFLPFLPRDWMTWAKNQTPIGPMDWFNAIWFLNGSGNTGNYKHLLGAGKAGNYDIDEFFAGLSQRYFDWSYVFRGTIEDLGIFASATEQQVTFHTQDTTVHELGHQFNVQACHDEGHHIDEVNPVAAWCSAPSGDPTECPPNAASPELCLMNSGKIRGDNHQAWDPVMEFCTQCLFLGDSICPSGSGGFRDGAIRTAQDPLVWN